MPTLIEVGLDLVFYDGQVLLFGLTGTASRLELRCLVGKPGMYVYFTLHVANPILPGLVNT